VYQGAAQLTLDAKGRLSMPTRHRDALQAQCEGRLTLTRHPDGCVIIYPRPRWEAKLRLLSDIEFKGRALQRLVVGSAIDTELDSTGRVLIPLELRTLCTIEREVMLLGVGEHFELWDRARHAAIEKQHFVDGLPEVATGFNF